MNTEDANKALKKIGYVANIPTPRELEDFIDDMDDLDREDASITWRRDWKAEMHATFENADTLIRVSTPKHGGSALFGVTKIEEGLGQAWLLQSSTFAEEARRTYRIAWPVRLASATYAMKKQLHKSYVHLFNFIPKSRGINIRLLKYCDFTFYEDPRGKADAYCFVSGPQKDHIGKNGQFWTAFLG